MKFTGVATELEIDPDEGDYEVVESIVTRARISMDWYEDGEKFHVVLESSDGVAYRGTYGNPIANEQWLMEATRYDAADSSVLLVARWHESDSGNAGVALFELDPTG